MIRKILLHLSVLLGSAVLVALIGSALHVDANAPKEITVTDWGTVTKITNCEMGKYSYYCMVYTDKVRFTRPVDITDFPYEGLEVGDVLAREAVCQDGRETVRWCRNGMCSRISSGSCPTKEDAKHAN